MRRTVIAIAIGLLLSGALLATAGGSLAADDVWTVTDWPASAISAADAVNGHLSPGELVLNNDPLDIRLLMDATDYPGIWDLEVCHGLLYMGAGGAPMHDHGGDIVAYDYESNLHWIDCELYDEGIAVLKAKGDTICSPGIDNLGSYHWGNLYVNTGSGWVRRETIPEAVHVLDCAFHDGRIWVTTGQGDEGLAGALFSSDDLGLTWTLEFEVHPTEEPGEFRRLYGVTSFDGSLWVQPDTRQPEGKVLFQFPPAGEMATHEVGAGGYCLAGFEEFRGDLLYRTSGSLAVWDGASWESCYPPVYTTNFVAHAMAEYDGHVYLGGSQEIKRTDDFSTWTSAGVEFTHDRDFKTFETYHGRLYVGSIPNGEVFVSAAVSRGEMTSAPHAFMGSAQGGVVEWDALIPDPTCAIRFQLRSAESEIALAGAEFLGPDGSADTWYETSGAAVAAAHAGDRWFQYRVELTTGDALLAPVLTEFRLLADLDLTGVADFEESTRLEVWPNPFRDGLNIRLAVSAADRVALDIFDVRGRRVRTLTIADAGTRLWDGRDADGDALPAGVYLIRPRGAAAPAAGRRVLLLR